VPWRLKSRSKTMNAGMFICLNIGVDPPDIVKTNPCAKMETWIDPGSMPSTKAIEQIGRSKWLSDIPAANGRLRIPYHSSQVRSKAELQICINSSKRSTPKSSSNRYVQALPALVTNQ
jgi:hypothetical protein